MTEPLDMSKDPDRFQPDVGPTSPLDPAADPDRFDPAASGPTRGRTLPELLGPGAQEEPRDSMTWLIGLLGVIGFLVVVSLLIQFGSR